MRVLVAGAGAIGGWLGAKMAGAGIDVTLLGRQALADAVAKDGLVVHGHTEFHGPVHVVTEPRDGGFDVVVLTCKAHATPNLAPAVAPLLSSDGVFVTLQNGLGNAEVLRALHPRVAVAITTHGVTVEAPGRLRHAGKGHLRVGPADPGGRDAAKQALELFLAAGLEPQPIDDATGHLWLKGAVNAGINPLCALHGTPNGGLEEVWDQAVALVEEVEALSRAAGVRLPGDAVHALGQTVEATRHNKCSMLQDVEAGRPTEIEQITGYFMRVARRLGYPLFQNEDVYRRVKTLEASYLGQEAADALTRQAAQAFRWP